MKYEMKRIVIDDSVIMSDDEQAVIDPLWWSVSIYDGEEKYEDDLKTFTLPQRYVFAIQWYVAEVNNGGHSQFYYNSTGIVWEDALKGFEAIGAKRNADIIEESASRLDGNPSKDRETRWGQLEQNDAEFDDLDNQFYESESEMQDLLHAYIRENAKAFYFDGIVRIPE